VKQRRIPTLAIRLGAVFAAVLGLFAAALVVTLFTLGRLEQADREVAKLDHAKHAGHLAAAQVREQYIHQAHTIISWDFSHLEHYEDVVKETRQWTALLRALARSPDERRLADEIARLAEASDREFRAIVLPAIRANDRSAVQSIHERTQALVGRVVELNERLNRSLERRSLAARAQSEALRRRARMATMICFGLAIAIAAGLGFLLTRSILRPIAALRSGALRIADGDLEARIEVSGRGELAELGATFNRMAADLARHQRDAVRAQKLGYVGQLAAGVAHEINNPLGVILGYAKLLRRDGDREELRIIEDEAVQCQRIVQGLLDLARPPRLDLGDVDLGELARDAVDRLRDTGRLDGVKVRTPEHAPVITWADEAKLRQVVTNVLLNAAEATPQGGVVTVEAASLPDAGVLVVQDAGPGIPAEMLPRVFDPFFTTKPRGTGLGLAVSQAIMDAHGGRIEIDSAPGRGTRVTLRVPPAARTGGV
jgi:two-component system, NtrC family, sensor kinase